jgi:EAL domain-containing protein (putative c-di-GMP-specific phosphodiesterase class I)
VHTFNNQIDIHAIIAREQINIYFQPIISVAKRSIIGLEALCRGNYNNEVIMPTTLFDLALKDGLTLELDRLCRRKALEAFKHISAENSDMILFLNFAASIIDQGVVGSGNLLNAVSEFGLQADKIVIEIIESKVKDVRALESFIKTYRNYGFMIALDDVGTGHSNLNRIIMAKPDILKIDRSIIDHIDQDFYKQEILRSLVSLSRKIGVLIVAEGIESESEAIMVLDIGVDMLQGFYLAGPEPADKIEAGLLIPNKTIIANRFKEYNIRKISARRSHKQEYDYILNEMVKELTLISGPQVDNKMQELVNRFTCLECVYILDENGFQVSETVFGTYKALNSKSIFQPAPRGSDHSMKDYYYLLLGLGQSKNYTEPYVSLASGNLCVTVSAWMNNSDGIRSVLCLDTKYSGIEGFNSGFKPALA